MTIKFRDVETAPLPVRAKSERAQRESKYPMGGIAIGGARVFPIGEGKPNSIRNSVYQTARNYQKKHSDFVFKVVLKKEEREVWVYRLSNANPMSEGDGGSPEGVSTAQPAVTNGDYDYSQIAAE